MYPIDEWLTKAPAALAGRRGFSEGYAGHFDTAWQTSTRPELRDKLKTFHERMAAEIKAQTLE